MHAALGECFESGWGEAGGWAGLGWWVAGWGSSFGGWLGVCCVACRRSPAAALTVTAHCPRRTSQPGVGWAARAQRATWSLGERCACDASPFVPPRSYCPPCIPSCAFLPRRVVGELEQAPANLKPWILQPHPPAAPASPGPRDCPCPRPPRSSTHRPPQKQR